MVAAALSDLNNFYTRNLWPIRPISWKYVLQFVCQEFYQFSWTISSNKTLIDLHCNPTWCIQCHSNWTDLPNRQVGEGFLRVIPA